MSQSKEKIDGMIRNLERERTRFENNPNTEQVLDMIDWLLKDLRIMSKDFE